MARKRGGLAGFYDRNKGWLKYVAPAAVGAIPGLGPMAAAAVGAAMGGDREGKSYFKGFDVGGAVKGGLSGYGMGKLGQGVSSSMFPRVPKVSGGVPKIVNTESFGNTPPIPDVAGKVPSIVNTTQAASSAGYMPSVTDLAKNTRSMVGQSLMPSGTSDMFYSPSSEDLQRSVKGFRDFAGSAAGKVGRAAGRATRFARENADVLRMAGRGIQEAVGGSDAEDRMMNLRERMYEDEQAEQRRIAELLMPTFNRYASSSRYGSR